MNFPAVPREFFTGECFDAYRYLGAHPHTSPDGQSGWLFRVWAPGAVRIQVCGGFDGWGPGVEMQRRTPVYGAPLSPVWRRGNCINIASLARTDRP